MQLHAAQLPPQSMPVSSPSCMPLPQVVLLVTAKCCDEQDEAAHRTGKAQMALRTQRQMESEDMPRV
jgi:hypothetical protein